AQIYADPPAASARRAGISAAVDSVLATALAKDPADRYPSCGRFAEELRAALRLRPGEPADPPRSPSPHGNGSVSGPRPASAGRVLLRVKQRPRPGAEDRPTAATNRSAEADSFAPAPASQPVTAGRPVTASQPAATSEPVTASQPAATSEPVTASQPVAVGQAVTAGEPSTDDNHGRPGPEPSGRRIRGRVLAAGAVAAVAAAVAFGLALSEGSAPAHPAAATPTPSASSPHPSLSSPSAAASPSAPVTAPEQAAALGALLTSSAAARTALHNAVTQVGGCTHLPGAVSQLQAVVNRRAGQYDQASALSTGALPGGAQVKSKLLAAL